MSYEVVEHFVRDREKDEVTQVLIRYSMNDRIQLQRESNLQEKKKE